MSLVIISNTLNLQPWLAALKKADPEVEVLTQDEVKDPTQVKFALAWNHPPGIFMNYPNLKTISSLGAGVDHLMSDTDIPPNVQIVRIIDPLLSQDMYEFVSALIMDRLKNISHFHEQKLNKVWKKKLYLRMNEVGVGIMGIGIIGSHVASGLQKAGFKVWGWSRTPGRPGTYKKYYGNTQLKDFLAHSDILVCLLPLTPVTRGILNRKHLQMLPEKSWVINVGRGGLVVDQDLIDQIDAGHLEGAHLDVFHEEPLPEFHPFWNHPKIHITPHNASLTHPESVAPQILDNYYRTLHEEPLLNLVDRKAGY